MNLRRSRVGAEGFTLIEIVVALAILGTSLVLLLESQYGALRMYDEARQEATLQMLVEQACGTAEKEVMIGGASGSGDFGQRWPAYSYSYSAAQLEANQMPGLFEVTVDVTGPDAEKQMVFYVYDGAQVGQQSDGTTGVQVGTSSTSRGNSVGNTSGS